MRTHLHVHLHDGLSDERRAEERPEGHEEVAWKKKQNIVILRPLLILLKFTNDQNQTYVPQVIPARSKNGLGTEAKMRMPGKPTRATVPSTHDLQRSISDWKW